MQNFLSTNQSHSPSRTPPKDFNYINQSESLDYSFHDSISSSNEESKSKIDNQEEEKFDNISK